jgi:hypothetical protein
LRGANALKNGKLLLPQPPPPPLALIQKKRKAPQRGWL